MPVDQRKEPSLQLCEQNSKLSEMDNMQSTLQSDAHSTYSVFFYGKLLKQNFPWIVFAVIMQRPIAQFEESNETQVFLEKDLCCSLKVASLQLNSPSIYRFKTMSLEHSFCK